LDPPDGARRGGGQLVETVVAVDHQHAGLTRGENSRHHLGQLGEGATNQTGPRLARISKRPKQIETVGTPISRRTADACRYEGWNCGAKQNPIPTSATLRATSSGLRSMRTPSASSVSAPPASDDEALFAVLDHRNAAGRHDDRRHRREVEGADAVATGTDDVDGLGPDLLGGQPRPCCSITSASSATSAAVGAFIFMATAKAASCAGVADPVMICSMAQPACPRGRS